MQLADQSCLFMWTKKDKQGTIKAVPSPFLNPEFQEKMEAECSPVTR